MSNAIKATAHVNLMTCVNSTVHGVNASAMNLAISKTVQMVARPDKATFVASQLQQSASFHHSLPGYLGTWTYTSSKVGTCPFDSRSS